MAISEQGWLSALRPAGMLRYVESTASEQKARLLGAACCRHVYGGVLDARAIAAVDIADMFESCPLFFKSPPPNIRAPSLHGGRFFAKCLSICEFLLSVTFLLPAPSLN